MGDFPFGDLVRPDGLYPHHATATCSGCGGSFLVEDDCYATYEHIWHSRCWPRVTREEGS